MHTNKMLSCISFALYFFLVSPCVIKYVREKGNTLISNKDSCLLYVTEAAQTENFKKNSEVVIYIKACKLFLLKHNCFDIHFNIQLRKPI